MGVSGIIAKQNSYMRAFRQHKASSPKSARNLKQLKITPTGVFYKMEKSGVFVKTEENTYYMDEEKAENFIKKRTFYARLLLGAVVFTGVVFYLIFGNI